jgi:hypothetical protein
MNEKSTKSVLDLANELQSNNIRFFFHDHDRWMTSTDIDISLNSKDITNFHKIMNKNEFKLLSKFPPWKLFYVKYRNGDIILFDTHLDAYEGVSKDILFPNSSNYFLDENKQLFYYIYRISIGQPCKKYEKYLKQLSKSFDEKMLLNYLTQYFKNANEIIQYLKEGNFHNISPKHKFRHNLIRGRYYLRNKLFKIVGIIKKIISPAPHVVIMGTDGSGKTTAVTELQKIFGNSKFKLYYEYGGRYTFKCLKFMNLFSKRMASNKLNSSKNDLEATGDVINYKSKLIEIISPFVYYLEYLLRTLSLYPKRIKYSAVLTDRWFYDLNTSPNASNKVVKFLNKLLPKPSLVVYLYNDIDVLITRKPDHPKSDLERQLVKFGEIENIFGLKIKSGNKGEVINEIMDRIIKLL